LSVRHRACARRGWRGTRNASGFTLVEVLVALTIMAVVAAMAWQGIDGISRSRQASQAALEQTLHINTVLAQWEQDLMSVEETLTVPALAFDGQTLRMTRSAEGGVQCVAWSLRDGVWRRWAATPTVRAEDLRQQWLRSQQLLGNEPGTLTMLEGASAALVYFWRGNSWSNAQSSGDQAAPPAGGASGAGSGGDREKLPSGVRIVLTLPGGTLTRDVVLAPQTP